jgi:hypothetical protein
MITTTTLQTAWLKVACLTRIASRTIAIARTINVARTAASSNAETILPAPFLMAMHELLQSLKFGIAQNLVSTMPLTNSMDPRQKLSIIWRTARAARLLAVPQPVYVSPAFGFMTRSLCSNLRRIVRTLVSLRLPTQSRTPSTALPPLSQTAHPSFPVLSITAGEL